MEIKSYEEALRLVPPIPFIDYKAFPLPGSKRKKTAKKPPKRAFKEPTPKNKVWA